jgi:glycine/D-amino acid oxidase-like deaminating enzyme
MKKALIIGGGFTGCSASYLLSMEGGWDIDLVETHLMLQKICAHDLLQGFWSVPI